MSRPRVICEVDTCTHWIPGNLCGAANIDILHEEEGKMAQADPQTECKTFYKKTGITSYLGSMDNVNWGGVLTGAFRDGTQVVPSVTCVVDTCTYWKDGNLCAAQEIKVTGQGANECQDTNCATFDLGNGR